MTQQYSRHHEGGEVYSFDPMVESEECFTIGHRSILMRASLEPWGQLEIVVKKISFQLPWTHGAT